MAEKKTFERVKMTKAVYYEDGSGPRAQVTFDSAFTLGSGDGERYLAIHGIGGDIHIHMKDVPFLIEALQEAVDLGEQAR